MIILSIDSSSKCLSVALKIDDSINQNSVNDERASKVILVEIDKILKKYDIKRETIDYIVFNRGPGSFTGTRVASSVIQAIAYTHNIPVIGISSMWLMAYQASRIRSLDQYCCIKHAYGEMLYISYFSSPLDKNNTNVKLIKGSELSIKDDENVVIEDSTLVKMFNLKHPNIINLSDHNENLDAISQIEALESNDYKEKNFNLKTTLPDYADHEV
ncbi:MAG: tRNA (adenosine(37)-N6)-threonylcarbamoyltransferase complex dimerization subunit type 1 TsaB [Pseudomonadota bacterium]|nr:tRNA (adenosine(37)-N6)-threonylcarbamoyltransferase complex dimerization subunit type 1 TsaB [Pseudomonadota bacterium]